MIRNILNNYNIPGVLLEVKQISTGNINKTYIVKYNNNGIVKRYLVQKINTGVFENPYELMQNIENVTNHIKNKLTSINDKEHQVLQVIKTKNNEVLCPIKENGEETSYYRIYNFIENSVSYDNSQDSKIVYNTGKAFGNFTKMLSDYPIEYLNETIKDFHNTKKRYEKFVSDINENKENRVKYVYKEIFEIIKRRKICSLIIDELISGTIPYRVTHNDTKVNNVMMNKITGDYLAVIDLDTVMPGSFLFDYGDGIRSTCSTAKEDETDLTKVSINLSTFKSYTDGYMNEMANYLKPREVELMGESIRIITLELAIRFLNDYINGDTYFKTEYANHNLDRARNQIALVKDIESKLDFINDYIEKSYNKYLKNKIVLKKVVKS